MLNVIRESVEKCFSARGSSPSWADVNHYYLMSLPQAQLQTELDTLHSGGVTIIRTFIQAEAGNCEMNQYTQTHPDVEFSLGTYHAEVMDRVGFLLTLTRYKVSYTIDDGSWTSLREGMAGALTSPLASNGALSPVQYPPWPRWQCNGNPWSEYGLMRISIIFVGYCEDSFGQCFLDNLRRQGLVVSNWQCWKRADGWWQADFSTGWGLQAKVGWALRDTTGVDLHCVV